VYQTPVYNISEILPPSAILPRSYLGPPRVVVPTVRTSVEAGEQFTLKAFIFSSVAPTSVNLFYRPIGNGPYTPQAMAAEAPGRQVYVVSIGAENIESDFEYYVGVIVEGSSIYFLEVRQWLVKQLLWLICNVTFILW